MYFLNIDATVMITYIISDFTHVQCICFIYIQELILRTNYQNQASIGTTLQHLNAELTSLKGQLHRRPSLKRKRSLEM